MYINNLFLGIKFDSDYFRAAASEEDMEFFSTLLGTFERVYPE